MSTAEMDLNTWSQSIFSSDNKNARYPISATLELTERCNNNCVHCYINQPASSQAARAQELTTEQVKAILDEITKAGCLFLILTGGEPLLRADFPEIYTYARRLGLIVDLLTNATMITPQIADLLAKIRPHTVDVTVYGATPETYEAVTRVPGSYARFINGLELLRERDIPISLKAIVLTLNKHELPLMRRFAKNLGVPFRYDGLLWPRLDGGKEPFKYQLSIDELLQMDTEYPMRAQEWCQQAEKFKGVVVRNEYVFSCGAGLRSYLISSCGKMSMCAMARKPAFDLLQVDFKTAWEQLGLQRQKKRHLGTACETCTAGTFCAQCPGWSQLIHGDDETPVQFVCQLGLRRAAQFTTGVFCVNQEEKVL